jgi:phospholipid-binding lipoprotein MlaA
MNFLMPALRKTALISGVLTIAACTAPVGTGINDPWEGTNRRTHAFNKRVDSALLRPTGNAYAGSIPQPVSTGISNFASNLATPSLVVNNTLQADVEGAYVNSWRFLLNSTLGLAGLIDVATQFGLPEHDTDFGQTLHVWGFGEGNYVELPLLGPSTERDTVGRIADMFTNPLNYIIESPEKYVARTASIAKRVGDRGRYGKSLDSVLYDSADSYAQVRGSYLQNRRYELGGAIAADADPYDETSISGDPYDDPYLQ